jgi:DNA-binding GntR family transcriptional regulator
MSSPMLDVLRNELIGGSAPSVERASVSDVSFGRLLRALVDLEVEPGRVVSERELMDRTGATRPTLRQAVARLADLGLITPMARKGLLIAPLDILDVSAVYDARGAIETAVARLAAERATRDQIANLKALLVPNSGEPDERTAFVAHDLAFHLALAAASRNRYLEDALTRILPVSARLWHRLYQEVGTDRRYMFEHAGIIAAIAKRDPDEAEKAMVAHLQWARTFLAKSFLLSVDGNPRAADVGEERS